MASFDRHYHAVQFYKDENSLARTVASFLADGLKVGEPAILIATPSHTALVKWEMTVAGVDVQDLRRTGEFQTHDARKMLSAFMIDGLPDPLLFRSNLGESIERLCLGRKPCPARAYGEMVDLLWQDGNRDGAIKLEILWNQLASTYDFSLLCSYAMGHFYKETRDERFQDVCEQHSHVMHPE